MLSAESLKYRGLFEPMAVQRLIAANDEGRVDASYTLLSLLCIDIWCRTFLGAIRSISAQSPFDQAQDRPLPQAGEEEEGERHAGQMEG